MSLTEWGIPFLTARWVDLCLFNFPVPPGLLYPHLPPGMYLDRLAGEPYVSLVALDSRDTRVLGVPWPGLTDFPEVHLRFYVTRGAERGVVFLRELVPQALVAGFARLVSHAPFGALPQVRERCETRDRLVIRHEIHEGERRHRMTVEAEHRRVHPGRDSVEHFFKEQPWRFGIDRSGRTLRYEVRHPTWDIYPVIAWRLEVDFAALYGPEWEILGTTRPTSVVLARGSEVEVYPYGAEGG